MCNFFYQGTVLPRQFLCPFTSETTYSRSFDLPQAYFRQICSQNDPCGDCCQPSCADDVSRKLKLDIADFGRK